MSKGVSGEVVKRCRQGTHILVSTNNNGIVTCIDSNNITSLQPRNFNGYKVFLHHFLDSLVSTWFSLTNTVCLVVRINDLTEVTMRGEAHNRFKLNVLIIVSFFHESIVDNVFICSHFVNKFVVCIVHIGINSTHIVCPHYISFTCAAGLED